MTSKLATLHELNTVYDYEDMLDLVEIIQVNAVNEQAAREAARK